MDTTLAKHRAADLVKRQFAPTWRYLFNLGPTVEHRRRPPVLHEEARRVLAELDAQGAATSTLEALTGDPTLLGRLQDLARGLEAREAEAMAARQALVGDGSYSGQKDFVVHLLGRHPVIDPRGLLATVALHEQLKGVADAYFGLRTSLADVNVWRNLTSDLPPRSSQMWHRDLHQDHFLLKFFIHLEDVDAGTGPFNYALGTHSKGDRRIKADATYDGLANRSEEENLATVVPRDRWREFTGPAGTVVFADTIGYHRGGWARTAPRLVFQALYTSQASARDYQLRLVEGADRGRWEKQMVLAPPSSR